MNFVEKPNDVQIQISGFEETGVACRVVTEAMGEDHPLVLPGDNTYGTSLWDELQRGVTQEPNLIFEGKPKDIIISALVKAADRNSGSQDQTMASVMLGSTAEPATASAPKASTVSRSRSPHAESSRKRHTRQEHRALSHKVALCSFGDMVAAQHAVAEFVGENADLLVKGREASEGHPSIMDAIDNVDPQRPKEVTFSGKDGRILLEALQKAANRDKTIYDAAAAHVLDVQEQPNEAHRPATERFLAAAGALMLHN